MPDYNNKIIYGNETLMDISEDTVTPQTLLSGETAHDRSGAPITGTATQGHVIQDDTTTFTQRSNLKFENATVTDDATNNQTIVNVGADPTTYSTNDSASTTINDTDYIPISESGGTKKKSLWSTIIAKIKTALGIESSGGTYLKKDGTWDTPTDSTKLPLAGGTMTGIISRDITSGTSYINAPAGNGSMMHLNKSEGDIWYAMVSTRTKGGGGWAIGNYNSENLQFIYGTKENITSGTNTTTGISLKPVAGTIAVHTATPTSGQVVISDGTDGGVKTSGYTIAKSVPSNAVFTDNNTTYTFATGDSNGQIKVTPSGGSAQNVSVKGLGSNAYTSTSYLPLAGGTMSGTLTLNKKGTTSDDGISQIVLGNSTKSGVADNSKGYLSLYSVGQNYVTLRAANSGSTGGNSVFLPYDQANQTLATTNQVVLKTGGTFTGNVDSTLSFQAANYVQGVTRVIAGAHTAEIDGTTYSQAGDVRIYGANGTYYASIQPNTMTANRTITLPASTCTLMGNNGGTFTGNVTVNRSDGTTTDVGNSLVIIGNATASGKAGNSYGLLRLYSSSTSYIQLRSQTTDSTRTLYLPISGTALATSASSSARVKENIRDMTEEEARKILDIDVVKFDYKEEFEPNLLDQSGVIAEEVIDIIPEVVNIHPMYDETKAIDPASNPSPTVDYAKFTPYLIKMIQMQQQKIEELEQRLAALES